MTMCAPTSRAFCSAAFRLSRTLCSKVMIPSPARLRGATLISRLNWPSSVTKSGSAMASSASAFFIAGSQASSTRLSSTSIPVIGRSKSNCEPRSIRANTSRQMRTFSR